MFFPHPPCVGLLDFSPVPPLFSLHVVGGLGRPLVPGLVTGLCGVLLAKLELCALGDARPLVLGLVTGLPLELCALGAGRPLVPGLVTGLSCKK